MGILETILGSVFGGGVTGILGVAVQRIADYKNKQLDLQLNEQKQSHEREMRKVDAEIMAQEWAGRTKVAETQSAGQEAVADGQAFSASFTEPTKFSERVGVTAGQAWLLVLLDFFRGMVRPTLTIYLCSVTTLIYVHARNLIGPNGTAISSQEAVQLVKMIVGTILYLTTTCVLWWFGTRNKQSPIKIQ